MRIIKSLINSEKSLGVVWRKFPSGAPLDTRTNTWVSLKPPSKAGLLLGRLQTCPRVSLRTLGTALGEIFPGNPFGFFTVYTTP